VYWKLDKTESFARMRLKLKRNYNFNDHRDAVAPSRGGGGGSSGSASSSSVNTLTASTSGVGAAEPTSPKPSELPGVSKILRPSGQGGADEEAAGGSEIARAPSVADVLKEESLQGDKQDKAAAAAAQAQAMLYPR
jgi:hypothetical protein